MGTESLSGFFRHFLFAVFACVHLSPCARAQEPIDYASLLPPIPPKEPGEALESFRLAEGLKIELVAAEPLIRDPMAMAFDERGRLYVVEFSEYNQRWAEGGPRDADRGRVKLLEDTDGDGRMDKSMVFADGLDFASAVFCWDGGIFLGMAPDVLYLKDTDGDGKADLREVVLTGFSREVNRAGQAPLNSFRWGLDNRIHVSTNFSGGAITSPKFPDKPPLTVRNRDILFDPRTGEFEATSGGGQHGMCFDDWGRKFVCRNSEPVKMIFYDDRYLANNPYLSAPAPAVDITEHGKYTKLFSISPEEPWRILRTKLRAEKKYRGSTEGPGGKVAVSGYFTASTGVTVYRGDALPEEFRGDIYTGEAANNLVYRARLDPDGVGLKARRATPESEGEFLASTDNWFRPVQLANGPDGALYVVDMYRFLIEGGAFLPPEALKHMDVRGGVDRGRIYRIVPEKGIDPDRRRIDLSPASSEKLVSLLEHSNGWHRDMAARLLYQRQDRSAIADLERFAEVSPSPLGRTHARYALDGLSALDGKVIEMALTDPSPGGQVHALRFAERVGRDNGVITQLMTLAVESPTVEIRYQGAFSLGAISNSGVNKVAALSGFLMRDGDDPWMQLAALSASGEDGAEIFNLLYGNEDFENSKEGETILIELFRQVCRRGDERSVTRVSDAIGEFANDQDAFSRRLQKILIGSITPELRRRLEQRAKTSSELWNGMISDGKRVVFDPKAKVENRVHAFSLLELAEFEEIEEGFPDLLKPDQPAEIQRAAIQLLGKFDDERIGKLLVKAWPSLGPTARTQVLDTLLSRIGWANQCLGAIRSGVIGRGEFGSARVAQLGASVSESVRKQAAEIFSIETRKDRNAVIAKYRPALDAAGDFEKGRAVFRKACVACHRLENVGTAIGANLIGIGKSGAESILLNILDPNRDVKPEHLMYTVTTKEGQTHAGMIRSESANSLTLRRLDGTDVQILRVEVEKLNGLGISFMPEGLEAQISVEEMANLLRYLVEVE